MKLEKVYAVFILIAIAAECVVGPIVLLGFASPLFLFVPLFPALLALGVLTIEMAWDL